MPSLQWVEAEKVAALLCLFDRRGLQAWVAGGWAVGALVGHQTRAYADLDLAVDAAQLDSMLGLLAELGLVVTIDQLLVRAELTAPDGQRIDLHPVVFAADGSGVQAGFDGATFRYAADGFAQGIIAGQRVPCLSARQQLHFRQGYQLRAVEQHDIRLLHRQGGSLGVRREIDGD
jgi:lincosamide nucleotidyltransferase A/C/D/E